jgi:adenylate kinase family enzyme
MKKIFIIGISGSGKSTLARQLSNLLRIPHFDLDDIFWIKKYTDKRKNEDCLEELKKILKKNNSWVIEGIYDWSKIAADKSDLVIWLNYGINLSTYRVFKRWLSRRKETKESIKELYDLVQYVRAYKKIRPGKIYSTHEKHQKIISGNEHNLVEIRNKKDLKELLKRFS